MEDGCESLYRCPCGRDFKRKSTYVRHMDIAHSNAESHKCRICGKTFGNANTLKMHMNIHQDSKNDAQIDRLTRSRKNRTPSGGRDKKERSGDRNRTKSPHAKRDLSKSKDKSTLDLSEKTVSQPQISETQSKPLNGLDGSNAKQTSAKCQVTKSNPVLEQKYQAAIQEHTPTATMQQDAPPSVSKRCSLPQAVEENVSISSTPVVIKMEPPSPPSVSDCRHPDTSPSVSPGAKENILPPLPLTSHLTSELVQEVKHCAANAPASSIVQTDNKVRLIDSTNTVRVNLQDSKRTPSTIVIKLEDSAERYCQQQALGATQSQQSQNFVQGHQSVILHLPETIASHAEQLSDMTAGGDEVGEDGEEGEDTGPGGDEDGMMVRKSIRLKGKTPGWRSWLEEEEQMPIRKEVCRRKLAKVKLEGEDYDIIEQVVNMSNELCMIGEDIPGTLSFNDDEQVLLDRTQNAMKRREMSKNTIACPVCSKEFVSEKYLSMHMSLHRSTGSDQLTPATNDDEEPPVKRAKPNAPGASAHWTCKICNKTFAQNSNFKNHIRTHSDERPFVCEICCIGFKERYHLKKHMLFKHSNELKEECRVCGKKFKDSTAVRAHERIHSDVRPYACRRCGKTFKTSECLWHHENRSKTCGTALDGVQPPASRFRRGRQPRKVEPQCPIMLHNDKVGSSDVQLVAHKQQQATIHTNGFKSEISIPTTVEALEVVPQSRPGLHLLATRPDNVLQVSHAEPQQHTSPLSSFPRSNGGNPVLVRIHSDVTSPIIRSAHDPHLPVVKVEQELELPDYDLTGLSSESSLDDSSQDLDFNELIGSEDDSDEIGSPLSLEDMDIQGFDQRDVEPMSDSISRLCSSFGPDTLEIKGDSMGKMRFFCVKCGKQFASIPAFEKHMATHSEMRPYKCMVCDIGFKLKVHLKKHNLYRHSNEYPCECSICGKKFKDSSAVRLHERIHSTDRPFKCDCGKSFKTRENLWGHRHRGPCEKKDMMTLPCAIMNQSSTNAGPAQVQASIANGHISAHATISNNEIIARAIVSNNSITAKATICNNGQLMASALIQGPKIHAQVMANGNDSTAHAQIGDKCVSKSSPTSIIRPHLHSPCLPQQVPIPETVVALQSRDEAPRPLATIAPRQSLNSTTLTLPTAVVAPIKQEKQAPIPQSIKSPPPKICTTMSDKGLPPFETFAPTIMSILQRPPRLPPGVSLPHLQTSFSQPRNEQTNVTSTLYRKSLTPSELCPTIQKHLQHNMPPPTKLPGIQQLFQTHSLAHANRQNALMSSPVRMHPGSPRTSVPSSPNPYLSQPPCTPPTSTPSNATLFLNDLPPPPPYPGNPNLGGPANADFRAKTPSSLDGGPSPCMPMMYWDDDSNLDKKLTATCSAPWQTETDTLFTELASGPAFSHL